MEEERSCCEMAMDALKRVLRDLGVYWRTMVIVFTPLLLLPLVFVNATQESRCAYLVILMAVFWMTEALPLGVTALLPVVALPLLGIVGAKQAASNFIKDSNMVFMGGLIMAISLEKSGLHKRMALRILLFIGTSAPRLLFGFMLASWFLSMWISNAAATAMMMPVAEAALQQLRFVMTQQLKPIVTEVNVDEEETQLNTHKERGHVVVISDKAQNREQHVKKVEEYLSSMCKMFCLGVAYAANVGGNATLMGNTPNLVFKGMLDEIYESYGKVSPINYTSWIPFALPGSFLCFFFAWIWLQIYALGFKALYPKKTSDDITAKTTRSIIMQEYHKLGPMTFAETWNLIFFTLLVLLWLCRAPGFVPGYASLFPDGYVTDVVPAMLICIFLFTWPAEKPDWICWTRGKKRAINRESLVDWKTVTVKFPWHLLFIMGGGFALADACQKSGLSQLIGGQLANLSDLAPWILVLLVCVLTGAMTEIATNTATMTLVMPILEALAKNVDISLIYLGFSANQASNFAFMLPVATGPNAIVYSFGHLKVIDMAKAGLVMKILSTIVITIALNTWGQLCFDMTERPWADDVTNLTAVDPNVTVANTSSIIV